MSTRTMLLIVAAATCGIGDTICSTRHAVEEFPRGAVTLLPGPLQEAQERNRAYLQSLDPHRLLHTFRLNAGLPSDAIPLGGWERPDCELRGHFTGHYLTACALVIQSSGDTVLLRNAGEVVRGLAACQQALNAGGYVSAFPLELLDRVETGKRVWAPWYTLHKIYQGLLDMASRCGDTTALRVLTGALSWVKQRTDRLNDNDMQSMLRVEFGGMGEVLVNAYRFTNNPDHLALARRFDKRSFTEPLARRTDQLNGLHANTHIPQAIAAARLYETTGELRYGETARAFWDLVVSRRTYVTGGTSNYEHWRTDPGTLAGELSDESHENCCTYNLLRLTRQLQEWGPDPARGDYYERAFLNGILPTQHPADGGGLMYFVPMQAGSFKMFGVPDSSYWCCNGTGIESFATLDAGAYYRDSSGVLIDQFVPSVLEWKERGITIRSETRYPEEQTVRFRMQLRHPDSFALKIRVPEWTAGNSEWRLNGRPLKVEGKPGTYARIAREWRDGDLLTVWFPMALRLVPLPGDPSMVSVMYGPVVLAAAMGSGGMTEAMRQGFGYPDVDRMFGEGASLPAPVIVPPSKDPRTWIKPVPGKPLTFVTRSAGKPAEVELRPFYRLFGERYAIYLKTRTAAQWKALIASRAARPAWLVDSVLVGDPAAEEGHNFQAWKYTRGTSEKGKWVSSPLWFRYDLEHMPGTACAVRLIIDAADTASFDLLADGLPVTTIPSRPGGSGVRTVTAPLELAALKDRFRIALMVRGRSGLPTPRLYGCSVIRVLRSGIDNTPGAHGGGYPLTPVPFWSFTVDDRFWSPRLETNRTVTIPHVFRQSEVTGRIRNFLIADSVLAGKIDSGKFCSRYGFDDSDVFKSIEAAAFALHTRRDPRLEVYLDTLIAAIARAQEEDGYIYTMRTINPPASWAAERWVNDRTKGSHELYNAGHLYEAAVAHHAATGKRTLLDVALRSADLLVRTFGPGKLSTVPGHQVTEIGLVKLFLLTGEREYLHLAKFFIDQRGRSSPPGETYNQDRVPIVDETEVVGHSVRAAYFYAGIADVAVHLNDTTLIRVLDRLWEDMVTKKLYVTGGIGSAGDIEGFGPPYELANPSAYCETCASIANIYWSYRMFLLHGDARYIDVMERVIYNGILPGVSIQGDRFFYPNPLSSIHGRERTPWFTCACCPPNVARVMQSLPGYAYARQSETLYVNLFIGGTASAEVGGTAVDITQTGGYPWEGETTIRLDPERQSTFAVKVRIPGWAREQPVPGDLYRYLAPSPERVRLSLNGIPVIPEMDRGYAVIRRSWKKGDRIGVWLPMQVRRVVAHPAVEADRGLVALQRGPIVYCLEGVDQPSGWVFDLVVPDTASISSEFRPQLLGGVSVLSGQGFRFRRDGVSVVRSGGPFTAIPYYAWAHRGKGQMTVWPARDERLATPRPEPTLASLSTVTASAGSERAAVNDLFEPSRSADRTVPYLHWWPRRGTTEWVQYDFPSPSTVSRVDVYWYDDTGTGECRVPAFWRVLYREGEDWKPVSRQPAGPPARDGYDSQTFQPVTTGALRLEVTSREGFAAGIHEWKVR